MNGVEACLSHAPNFHMCPMRSLNALCNFVSSHTLGTQSKNERNELLCCNFTRRVSRIGPNGMDASYEICNRRKTNKSGRLNVGGSVANKNTLFSNDSSKDLLLFYHFKVMSKLLPYFTNTKDFTQKPTLRLEINCKGYISYHYQHSLFKKLHDVIECAENASTC